MTFSIILPNYNNQSTLLLAIKSAINQDFTNWELLVVDDGSLESHTAITSQIKDPRVRFFEITHVGRAGARNFAISKAKGQYITFLDADDQFTTDHLSNFDKIIKSKIYDSQLIHSSVTLKIKGKVDELILFTTKELETISEDQTLAYIHKKPIGISFCFPRKHSNDFQFDTRFHSAEDKHLVAKIANKHGWVVHSMPSYIYFKNIETLTENKLVKSIENQALAMTDLYELFGEYSVICKGFNQKESTDFMNFRASYLASYHGYNSLSKEYLKRIHFSELSISNMMRYIKRYVFSSGN